MTQIDRDVSASDDGIRLSDFLLRRVRLSRRFLARLKQTTGGIRVNGIPARADRRLAACDTVSFDCFANEPDSTLAAEYQPLHILYEDRMLAVIDKPAGMAMYPHHPGQTGSLAPALLGHLLSHGQRPVCHLLTRLDIGTSGLVLAAKNAWTAERLQRQGVHKAYQCIAFGCLNHAMQIDLPLAQAPEDLQQLGPVMSVRSDGKASSTWIRPLLVDHSAGLTYARVLTASGRRHQIRVHLAHCGHPLMGDTVYGGPSLSGLFPLLHAAGLWYNHPEDGRSMMHFSPFWRDLAEPFEWQVFACGQDIFEKEGDAHADHHA
jgi:23S rRNA pseudouridine1911/1915/1917 synthase